jgi:hypothetical protein
VTNKKKQVKLDEDWKDKIFGNYGRALAGGWMSGLSTQEQAQANKFIDGFTSTASYQLKNAVKSGLVDPTKVSAPSAAQPAAPAAGSTVEQPAAAQPAAPAAGSTVEQPAAPENRLNESSYDTLNRIFESIMEATDAAEENHADTIATFMQKFATQYLGTRVIPKLPNSAKKQISAACSRIQQTYKKDKGAAEIKKLGLMLYSIAHTYAGAGAGAGGATAGTNVGPNVDNPGEVSIEQRDAAANVLQRYVSDLPKEDAAPFVARLSNHLSKTSAVSESTKILIYPKRVVKYWGDK